MKEALNKQFQQEQQVTHQFEHPVLLCQQKQQVTHQFEHPLLLCLLLTLNLLFLSQASPLAVVRKVHNQFFLQN